MSLKEILMDDMKQAMKDKAILAKNTIQMVRAAVLQIEKDSKITLDDDGVIEVILKEVKKRKDSLPDYQKSGRQDLANDLQLEIEVLFKYLPQQLSDSELEEVVENTARENELSSVKDIGKLMQAVMPKVKGRADGKRINEIARRILT